MPSTRIPKLRRKTTGKREYAVVRLADSVTKQTRDVPLGNYGTAESLQNYSERVQERLSVGRRSLGAEANLGASRRLP